MCGSGIVEAVAELFLAGVIDADGTIRGDARANAPTESCPTVARSRTCCTRPAPRGCVITQNDVRAIQLAKAALRAGHRPADGPRRARPTVADIRLAGAFGAHIDPLYAMVLGLDPGLPARRCPRASATRPEPARCARCCSRAAQRTRSRPRSVGSIKIETAIEPRFQEHFVAAMAFPHSTAPNPHLAQLVELPARRDTPPPVAAASRNAAGAAMSESTDPQGQAGTDDRTAGTSKRWARRAAGRCGPRTWWRASRSSPARSQPFEVVTDEGLEIIEHNADTILEEVGIEVHDHPGRARPVPQRRAPTSTAIGCGSRAGCAARSCRPPRRATYTQHARNPAHNVQIGGDATVFAPNYGSPFVHDLDHGRRYATLADFENFVKLAYLSPNLHHSGGTVCEPVDVPVNKRHLDMVYAHLRYSDKPFMGSVTAGTRGRGQRRARAHRLRRRPRRTAR